MDEEKKGFVVKDRRFFGEDKDKEAEGGKPAEKPEPEGPAASGPEAGHQEIGGEDYLPEVNFYNFVVSMSTTALFHFGDFAGPEGEPEKNLPAVKQIIDTLAMLQQKTEGNLDAEERQLMEGVLYELRMRYVKESA